MTVAAEAQIPRGLFGFSKIGHKYLEKPDGDTVKIVTGSSEEA